VYNCHEVTVYLNKTTNCPHQGCLHTFFINKRKVFHYTFKYPNLSRFLAVHELSFLPSDWPCKKIKSYCRNNIFYAELWVTSMSRGGSANWFPSRQKKLMLDSLPASPASRVIIPSTRLTRFPPRARNYNLASHLYCETESSERVIIPMYINTHIWQVKNSPVCFPNSNARRRISAVGMDPVCHAWYGSVDVPLHSGFFYETFPPSLRLPFPSKAFDWQDCRMICFRLCDEDIFHDGMMKPGQIVSVAMNPG